MLRASFLLFSLLLGAATGDSLFSRKAIFCGGGGEDNAPVNAPVGAPVDSPVDSPNDAPVDSPVDSPNDPPIDAPVDSPTGPTTRTCSILVGDGLCLAANDNWYPMCYTDILEAEAMSKEDCQNVAVNKSDATGWTYVSGFDDVDNKTYAECTLYVDATNVEYRQNYTCPDNGLTWYKDFFRFFSVGTGPIQTTEVGYPGYPCYTCALTYTPPVTPPNTRTCSLFGNGTCIDAAQEDYPYCYKELSEELCNIRAAQNSQVIGYTYDAGCYMHYDAAVSHSCPSTYIPDESDPPRSGSGAIEGTSGSGECFVCVEN